MRILLNVFVHYFAINNILFNILFNISFVYIMRLSRKKGVKKNKTAKKKYVMKGGIKTNLMKLMGAEIKKNLK